MSFEITGTLVEKMDIVQVSEKFTKREFVIEVKPDNPNLTFTDMVKIQLTNDKCDLIDSSSVGDDIKVNFNIRGRKWEKDGKVSYFTNLEGWKIESAGTSNTPATDDVPF